MVIDVSMDQILIFPIQNFELSGIPYRKIKLTYERVCYHPQVEQKEITEVRKDKALVIVLGTWRKKRAGRVCTIIIKPFEEKLKFINIILVWMGVINKNRLMKRLPILILYRKLLYYLFF